MTNPPLDDETKAAINAFLENVEHIASSTGPHEGHEPRQVGRCVHCSCGQRFQGYLRKTDTRTVET